MKENKPWPKVLVGDHGIRPAGAPDACLYCRAKIGDEHGRECVTIEKTVRVRLSVEVTLKVPHSWTPRQVEFHVNDSSTCADNFVDAIEREMARVDAAGGCLCGNLKGEFVREEDAGPLQNPPTIDVPGGDA